MPMDSIQMSEQPIHIWQLSQSTIRKNSESSMIDNMNYSLNDEPHIEQAIDTLIYSLFRLRTADPLMFERWQEEAESAIRQAKIA